MLKFLQLSIFVIDPLLLDDVQYPSITRSSKSRFLDPMWHVKGNTADLGGHVQVLHYQFVVIIWKLSDDSN